MAAQSLSLFKKKTKKTLLQRNRDLDLSKIQRSFLLVRSFSLPKQWCTSISYMLQASAFARKPILKRDKNSVT